MEKFDVIVIGSGLGGLVSASILSKEGMKVCVLEQDERIGGTLQSFVREGVIFGTGINYTESLGEGDILYRYFKYLGIMDSLKIKRLDIAAFDKISFGNDDIEYPFAQGHDNFVDSLCKYFPKERENLNKYIQNMAKVCNSFPYYDMGTKDYSFEVLMKQQSASEFLKSTTPDLKLQKVLAGMNSLYAGIEGETPMYIHSLINYSFIKSAWRFINGSSQLAVLLAKGIRSNGGVIRTSSKVVALNGDKSAITSVDLESGDSLAAKYIISNAHPASTLNLLGDNMIRKNYRKRILNMENSVGMFSVYIVLKKNSLKQFNYNHHHFPNSNVWSTNYKPENWPEHFMLYSPLNTKSGEYSNGLTVLSYMRIDELDKWVHTNRSTRTADYIAFKEEKTKQLLRAVEKKFPGIGAHIKSTYSSTPLSYRDYTGTPNGSAYGILKNAENPMLSLIKPKSKINNLFFTGQNLNMHGILGVTISSVLACQQLLGGDYLNKKIQSI